MAIEDKYYYDEEKEYYVCMICRDNGKLKTYQTERGIIAHIEGKHPEKLTEAEAATPLPEDKKVVNDCADGIPPGMHID